MLSRSNKMQQLPVGTMVLTGRLSNHDLTTLLQRLTSRECKQARIRRPAVAESSPDGRRSFGSVSNAVLSVLVEAGSQGLRATEIQGIVQAELGGVVSASSIKNHLAKNCYGEVA